MSPRKYGPECLCSSDLGEWRRWRGAVNYGRRRRQATKEMWHRISLSTDLDCSKWRSCTPVSDHDDDEVVFLERVTEILPDFNESFQLPVAGQCGTLSSSHVAYACLRKPDARHCRANTNSVAVANFFKRSVNISAIYNCVKWQRSWQWHWSARGLRATPVTCANRKTRYDWSLSIPGISDFFYVYMT